MPNSGYLVHLEIQPPYGEPAKSYRAYVSRRDMEAALLPIKTSTDPSDRFLDSSSDSSREILQHRESLAALAAKMMLRILATADTVNGYVPEGANHAAP